MRIKQGIVTVGAAFSAMLMLLPSTFAMAQVPVPSAPTVSVADLTAVGFTGVIVQASQSGGYQPPNVYFRVKETLTPPRAEWGGTADLVAVSIFPMTYAPAFSMPQMQVSDFAGRTNACMTRPGYYVCVTGPQKDKVIALANLLVTK